MICLSCSYNNIRRHSYQEYCNTLKQNDDIVVAVLAGEAAIMLPHSSIAFHALKLNGLILSLQSPCWEVHGVWEWDYESRERRSIILSSYLTVQVLRVQCFTMTWGSKPSMISWITYHLLNSNHWLQLAIMWKPTVLLTYQMYSFL